MITLLFGGVQLPIECGLDSQILYYCFLCIVKCTSEIYLNLMVTEQAKTASLELLTIAVQVKPGFSEITECRPLTR